MSTDTSPTAQAAQRFSRLLEIVARLRAPDGCPWDREQTPETIAPYMVEEAHEVLEAVERGDPAELCEELGDVLLEVALLAQMAGEAGRFTVADSLESICDKLVRRHPHVFGDRPSTDAAEVRASWAAIKAEEKRGKQTLGGVPRRLPALHRARRVSEKAAGVGFDWQHVGEVLAKVDEEFAELREAIDARDLDHASEELGDVLFALVNVGRHLHLDPEVALHRTVEKFMRRFASVERALANRGTHPADASLEEMEALWQAAKTERNPPRSGETERPRRDVGVGEPADEAGQ